jgi:hypothetical protein
MLPGNLLMLQYLSFSLKFVRISHAILANHPDDRFPVPVRMTGRRMPDSFLTIISAFYHKWTLRECR